MEQTKVKTFIQALNCYPDDIRKLERYLLDKRLSETEKKVLRSWLLLRDKKFAELIDTLTPLTSPYLIVQSQIEALIGIAYNNQGDFPKAITKLEKARAILANSGLSREKFVVLNNLFIVYWNLENRLKMEEVLEELSELELDSRLQKIDLLRIKFNYYTFTGNYTKATYFLKQLDQKQDSFTTFQQTSLFIDKFIYYLRQDKFNACEKVLDEMKASKKFTPTETYKYMRVLFGYITNKVELNLYPHEFKNHPFYLNEIQCLVCLETGEKNKAKSFWKELSNLYPHLYGNDFSYLGKKCLFSMALDKVMSERNSKPISSVTITADEDVGSVLLRIISLSGGAGISREELYRMLYKSELAGEKESKKLSELIRRLKIKHGIEVKIRKGFYYFQLLKSA